MGKGTASYNTERSKMKKTPKQKLIKKLEKQNKEKFEIEVYEKYGNKCFCGLSATEIHHYIPVSVCLGMRYFVPNGVPICRKCHSLLKFNQGSEIDAKIILTRGDFWLAEIVATREYWRKNQITNKLKFLEDSLED